MQRMQRMPHAAVTPGWYCPKLLVTAGMGLWPNGLEKKGGADSADIGF